MSHHIHIGVTSALTFLGLILIIGTLLRLFEAKFANSDNSLLATIAQALSFIY